jgi:hypothetical protein
MVAEISCFALTAIAHSLAKTTWGLTYDRDTGQKQGPTVPGVATVKQLMKMVGEPYQVSYDQF